jgi:hypothetical protein
MEHQQFLILIIENNNIHNISINQLIYSANFAKNGNYSIQKWFNAFSKLQQ